MSFTIDCRDCRGRHTDRCDDCLVTFLIGRDADDAVVVDAAEFAALRRLARAGLVPSLRHTTPSPPPAGAASRSTPVEIRPLGRDRPVQLPDAGQQAG